MAPSGERYRHPRDRVGAGVMIERNDATGIVRRGFTAGRKLAVTSVAGVGIGVIGVLVWPHDVGQPGLLAGLVPSVSAQTSKPAAGLPDFPDMVERVKPAVVGIRAQLEDATVGGPEASPMDRFFGLPKEKSDAPRRPRRATSQGSGFFISADGYIVTSNHVIENGKSIE